MLDSTVAMKHALFTLLFVLLIVWPARAQTDLPSVAVTLPKVGQVLQGAVTVAGSSEVTGFTSAEIAFAYSGDTTGTWFLVAVSEQPVSNGTLAVWDTTRITDGNYVLRLRVFLEDGKFQQVLVPQLRVRNYTPPETPTPTATLPAETLAPTHTPVPSSTPTPTPFPTPTLMPPNPAVLAPTDVWISLGYGGAAVILFLLILNLYLRIRRK
jgi:hypothetical protein